MTWKEFDLEQWAEETGIDLEELRQKEKLIKKIIKARKEFGLTQKELAHLVGVSQSRIAQIESRVGMDKITFDVLLRVLQVMGFGFSISARKIREPDLETLVA